MQPHNAGVPRDDTTAREHLAANVDAAGRAAGTEPGHWQLHHIADPGAGPSDFTPTGHRTTPSTRSPGGSNPWPASSARTTRRRSAAAAWTHSSSSSWRPGSERTGPARRVGGRAVRHARR
jgi:hypothetical protein